MIPLARTRTHTAVSGMSVITSRAAVELTRNGDNTGPLNVILNYKYLVSALASQIRDKNKRILTERI